MLTESVSDPRRANWLTISMSEDLCWPDEPSTTRPNWELEAEILRLTTRLMMREGEVRQMKIQLKSQAAKAQQQASSWRRRMEEKEEQMKELLLQKDAEMQNIVSQLLLFEAELRREQSRIEDLLAEKDLQIKSQKKEIDRLKNDSIAEERSSSFENSNSDDREFNLRTSTIVDDCGSNSRSGNSADKNSSFRTSNSGGKNLSFRSFSSPDKNSIYGNANLHEEKSSCFRTSGSEDRSLIYRTSNSEDSGVVISSSDSCPSPLEDISDIAEEYSKGFCPPAVFEDSQTNPSWTLTDINEEPHNRHRQPALFKESPNYGQSKTFKDKRDTKEEFLKQRHFVFEDPYDSNLAVQKLRDGLGKIRAIQDVTNVKSLEHSYDCVVPDKKRMPYKAPQKMKDLKAKRSINTHNKNHRNVGEINNQVIL
ncbi:hypothetical protein JTE90_005958 [Oedothorax gibbosus]|uniref:Uncharacterized protein n=1 Tax=Oedothorax gibbosus TaxID=931172 RepID=A0AAV6UY23_9ARAC|nr:hypothetical protein JTE90_005958 [Oedothorax gibbosus]